MRPQVMPIEVDTWVGEGANVFETAEVEGNPAVLWYDAGSGVGGSTVRALDEEQGIEYVVQGDLTLDEALEVLGGLIEPAEREWHWPPPPEIVPFIEKDGFIEVYEYDDRNLSPEEKAADPMVNPRWAPFAACMADAGYEVRDDPSTPFLQDDLDRLEALINQDGPFIVGRSDTGPVYDLSEGAEAFVECGERYLHLSIEELEAIDGGA